MLFRSEVIRNSIAKAKEFIATRTSPDDSVRYLLAGGLLGILAATNEEVEWSYRVNLILILITIFFQLKNGNYISAPNFTNLMVQMAAITTIAIGVVFVLLLGEIDLSIGYVSGVAGVIVAELQVPDGSWVIKIGRAHV